MIDATTVNAPNWIDLSTSDVDGASRFYEQLFGWEFETTTSPMGPYRIARVGGRQVGGVMAPPPDQAGMPAMWTVFFRVADLEQTVGAVERVGGTVPQAPFSLPDGTRIAVGADPAGAMFGLIAGEQPPGAWLSQDPGAVRWVELLTRDVPAAETFYAQVFGWKATTLHGQGGAYTTFDLDGDEVAGMMAMPAEVPPEAPSNWSVYFSVADCAATEKRARALGGRVLRATSDLGLLQFAILTDPAGASFGVLGPREWS